ncbi:MAG: hypothetical protein ACRYFR_03905 [Janthinobacterium lividum]
MKSILRPQIAIFLLSFGALFSNNISAATAPSAIRTACTLTAFDEGKADGNAYRISALRAPNGTDLIIQQVRAAQSAATVNPSTAPYFEGYVAGLEPSRELTSISAARAQQR